MAISASAMAAPSSNNSGYLTIGSVALEKPVLDINGKPSQKAPDWVVEIAGEITKGNLEGFETYSQLFDFHFEYSRTTDGHVANEMFTSAAIEHSEVYILIPAGTYTAKIRQALNTGKLIDTITIKRLGNMTALKKPLQVLTYSDCLFTRAVQDKDWFAVAFRFTKVKEENIENAQADEGQAGQNVSEIDYSKVTSA